jgi:hypothetical protein
LFCPGSLLPYYAFLSYIAPRCIVEKQSGDSEIKQCNYCGYARSRASTLSVLILPLLLLLQAELFFLVASSDCTASRTVTADYIQHHAVLYQALEKVWLWCDLLAAPPPFPSFFLILYSLGAITAVYYTTPYVLYRNPQYLRVGVVERRIGHTQREDGARREIVDLRYGARMAWVFFCFRSGLALQDREGPACLLMHGCVTRSGTLHSAQRSGIRGTGVVGQYGDSACLYFLRGGRNACSGLVA